MKLLPNLFGGYSLMPSSATFRYQIALIWTRLLSLAQLPFRSARVFLLAALLALLLGRAAPAYAIGCSVSALITAINSAASGSTITLATDCAYTLFGSVDGNTGLPQITNTLTLSGNNTIIERSTTAGTPSFRLMSVSTTGNLTLNNLTLRYGDVITNGGAIENAGTLTLNSTLLYHNHANLGGAIFIDGARTVTLNSSRFYDNSATDNGGAIFNSAGTVTLQNSTVESNTGGNLAAASSTTAGL